MTKPLSRGTQRAIAKYGQKACEHAYYLNQVVGEGPCFIGGYGKGRELATGEHI